MDYRVRTIGNFHYIQYRDTEDWEDYTNVRGIPVTFTDKSLAQEYAQELTAFYGRSSHSSDQTQLIEE